MKTSARTRKGFTLVELLTVIAIIGILAAILIPTVGRVMDMANRAGGQSNTRSIAQVYFSYSVDGSRPRSINNQTWQGASGQVSSVAEWAGVLADQADLNDASLYYLPFDPSVEQAINVDGDPEPNVVGSYTSGRMDGIDPDFNSFVYSVTVVRGLSTRLPASSTPVLWTSGLGTDGIWVDGSPYRGDGGHIGFVDGHVEWLQDTGNSAQNGVLVGTDKTTTNNILETINAGAQTFAQRGGGEDSEGSADNSVGTGN